MKNLNKYFWCTAITALIIASLFLLVKIKTELKGYNRAFSPNVISVSGEGKVFVKPDIGLVTVSVVKNSKELLIAQKQATEAVNSLFVFLKSKGIEEKDTKTIAYNIGPRYDYSKDGTERLHDYEVRQELTIKIRDVARAGEVLAGATGAGANKVGSLGFVVDDPDAAKSEARGLAIEDARKKAVQLSKQLGVRFKKIVSFYESEGGFPGPIYFAKEAAVGMGGDFVSVPSVPAGENEIKVNVSINYEIR